MFYYKNFSISSILSTQSCLLESKAAIFRQSAGYVLLILIAKFLEYFEFHSERETVTKLKSIVRQQSIDTDGKLFEMLLEYISTEYVAHIICLDIEQMEKLYSSNAFTDYFCMSIYRVYEKPDSVSLLGETRFRFGHQ